VPAAAVIPAEKAYTNIVAVKTLVVGTKKGEKQERIIFDFGFPLFFDKNNIFYILFFFYFE